MPGFERLRELLADRRPVVTVVVVAALGAAAVVLLSARPSAPAGPELTIPLAVPATVAPSPTPEPPHVVVHVAGAVGAPGVYDLAGAPRVADAIAAAGGTLASADLTRVNLAAPAVDGQRIWVPAVGEEGPPPVVAGASAGPGSATDVAGAAGGPVDLNTADEATLDTLPGVGPATAAAIVDHRDEHGPFVAVDQLLDVAGIGPAKLEAIRDLVVVGT